MAGRLDDPRTATAVGSWVRAAVGADDPNRLVANRIRVVGPNAPIPELPVACAVWEPEPSWSTSTEAWLMAGGPHHTVLSTAVDARTLDHFATMTRTELLDIDGDTTTKSFARELKWNAVYHHIAAGL
ncbi:hypothetical protein [Williamsia sp. CHRR-6]|uniref:hypothetical protein n=1 Tax=Williamsia sp. CHRR-6 TaxID=2835871 RepID=UPI0027DD2088|nr:hypothetical protein [Williamsia sp. CHRR-6]